jgi:hypothetical protein
MPSPNSVLDSGTSAEPCWELLSNDASLENFDTQRQRAIRHWAGLVLNISAIRMVRLPRCFPIYYCIFRPASRLQVCSLGAFWTDFWYMNFLQLMSGITGIYGALKAKDEFVFVVSARMLVPTPREEIHLPYLSTCLSLSCQPLLTSVCLLYCYQEPDSILYSSASTLSYCYFRLFWLSYVLL